MRHATPLVFMPLFALAALSGCIPYEREPGMPPPPYPPPPGVAARRPARPRPPPLVVASGALTARASSTFAGWPAERAIDGDPQTSWFSNSNDSAARGQATFFEVGLAAPGRVTRVQVLGNREPSYPTGYSIRVGRLDLFGERGALLFSAEAQGHGAHRDFDFRVPATVGPVARARFTSLDDEGDQNGYGDVAIGELIVE